MISTSQALGRAIVGALPPGARLDAASHIATFGDDSPLWGIEVRGQPARVVLDVVATGKGSLLEMANDIRSSARAAAHRLKVDLVSVDVNVVGFDAEGDGRKGHEADLRPADDGKVPDDGEAKVEPILPSAPEPLRRNGPSEATASIVVHIYTSLDPAERNAA
jgi:hypothetical protein